MTDFRDAIRRAEGRHPTGEEAVRSIEAFNAGAAAASEQGLDDTHLVYEDGDYTLSVVCDPNVGPEAIIAIEAVIEAAKRELGE